RPRQRARREDIGSDLGPHHRRKPSFGPTLHIIPAARELRLGPHLGRLHVCPSGLGDELFHTIYPSEGGTR
ncbi:hypothetical protein QM806_41400, partial [Rhodococcus sp. IEGM 1351]|uniref:hypothetical protein n=1 Tax=Rhodococcus sp. IEGM 1351 TaxID=3047089 RepID=UPI0024B7BA50